MPLVGLVCAGPLSEAVEAVRPFEFDAALRGDETNAAVLVSDDSLLQQRIVAGDYLIGPQRGGRIEPKWLVRQISE